MNRVRIRRTSPVLSLRATSVGVPVQRADISRQVDDADTLNVDSLAGLIISPPYNIDNLKRVYEKSNTLGQCVAAMVTNVTMYGYQAVPITENTEPDPAEREELQSFIDYANTEQSLRTVMSLVEYDYERYGFAFLEVIRDQQNRISLLRHCPAFNTRLLRKDARTIKVQHSIKRGRRQAEIVEFRRFRRYVQTVGAQRTYFKEFGDPRLLDYQNGEYESREHRVPIARRATELIHFKQPSDDVYGIPRWVNQLPSILGSRESEEVNLRYFEDNTVPPMLLSVAGGRLTRQSFNDLQRLLTEQSLGKDRQNQILLIEAVAENEGLDGKGTVSLKVDKLADVRPQDALFTEYDQNNQTKVRSAFRLPPVVIGMSQDINYATANVSTFVAETQVFSPERAAKDEILNNLLVNGPQGLNLKTVKLVSRGPAVTNPEQVVKAMTALNVMGAITPRDAVTVANQELQLRLPQYPAENEEGWEPWMDAPLSLEMKRKGGSTKPPRDNIEQDFKDEDIKEIEEDGDIGFKQPEHGNE